MTISKNRKKTVLLIIIVIVLIFVGDYIWEYKGDLKDELKYPNFLFLINYYLVFFIVYFANFFMVCPKYFKLKKIGKFLILSFGLIAFFGIFRYFLDEILSYTILEHPNYVEDYRSIPDYFQKNILHGFKATSYSSSLFFFVQYINNIKKIHQLELEQKKSELRFLKSQLSPHFLFNTLNTFYSELIDSQPETAKDIQKLSELLRYVTYEAQDNYMPLEKEIQFIKDYIYFYKKRFEDELFVALSIEGKIENKQIPSLVFIHFIENLFKHGMVNDKENPASIQIVIQDNYVSLKTENTIMTSEKYMESGIGTQNLKRRLKSIYNTNFELEYQKENDIFTTYLKIPL